jgi:hypothetical protein
MDEKIIDTLWQVKEGKKHPTTAYKEILQLISDNYVSKETVKEMISYIEESEVLIDGEFGRCRSVSELTKEDLMPEIYYKLVKYK